MDRPVELPWQGRRDWAHRGESKDSTERTRVVTDLGICLQFMRLTPWRRLTRRWRTWASVAHRGKYTVLPRSITGARPGWEPPLVPQTRAGRRWEARRRLVFRKWEQVLRKWEQVLRKWEEVLKWEVSRRWEGLREWEGHLHNRGRDPRVSCLLPWPARRAWARPRVGGHQQEVVLPCWEEVFQRNRVLLWAKRVDRPRRTSHRNNPTVGIPPRKTR